MRVLVYLLSLARSMETSWRKAGMRQTGTDEGKILCLLFARLYCFICLYSRRKTKNAQGVLRRGEAPGRRRGRRRVSPEVHFNCSEAKKKMKEKKQELENNSGLLLCQEVLVKWQKLVFSLHLSLPHLICCCFSSNSPLLL